MLRLSGITPVMVTTFREDESIDEDALRRQIDFAISAGATALCGPGFGSEYYKLSDPERYRFVEILITHAQKRVPVIAATSSGSIHGTIEFSKHAQELGADCIMVTPPKAVNLPGTDIVRFYRVLCSSIDLPVMLQDADFSGPGLSSAVFAELAKDHPNFSFAKLETIMPGHKCSDIIEQTRGQVQIVFGMAGISMLEGLDHGACAVMPGCACTEVYSRVFELDKQGNRAAARELFYRLIPYIAFGIQHLELAVYLEKRVLLERGVLPNARMRLPTLSFDSAYKRQIEELVSRTVALCEECSVQSAVG